VKQKNLDIPFHDLLFDLLYSQKVSVPLLDEQTQYLERKSQQHQLSEIAHKPAQVRTLVSPSIASSSFTRELPLSLTGGHAGTVGTEVQKDNENDENDNQRGESLITSVPVHTTRPCGSERAGMIS